MTWQSTTAEESELQRTFMETAGAVGEAFCQVVGQFGYASDEPIFGKNPNDDISRWVTWWISLPDTYESMSCELDLLDSCDGPEVFGRIAVWRYLGKGVSLDDDLWRSENISVSTALEAAQAFRQVGTELVRQCTLLDFRPYLPARDKPNT